MSRLVPSGSSVPAIPDEKWRELTAPVRRGLSSIYLEKTRKALDAGLHDAAVTYIWDLVANDLRMKVESYGVDIFTSVEDGVKYHPDGATLQDRWRDIQDHRLLSGCLKLNLISRTAFRHLSHILTVRNHESAAHPVAEEEELDLGTAVYFLGDAVKFVLSRDMPEPGFNLKTMVESLKTRDLSSEAAEISGQLERLSMEQANSALGMMVSIFVSGSSQAKNNVQLIVDQVWRKSSEEAKRKIGEKYAKFSGEGESDSKAEIFSLLVAVDGVGTIPSNLRRILFEKAAQDLKNAHFAWYNFEGEIAPARQLSDLGVNCPDDAMQAFCEAFLVSYMGNYYKVSKGAQPYLSSLREKFTHRHWEGIMETIRTSDSVQSEINSNRPFERLKELCAEMRPALVSAKDKRDCEFIIANGNVKVLKRFAKE